MGAERWVVCRSGVGDAVTVARLLGTFSATKITAAIISLWKHLDELYSNDRSFEEQHRVSAATPKWRQLYARLPPDWLPSWPQGALPECAQLSSNHLASLDASHSPCPDYLCLFASIFPTPCLLPPSSPTLGAVASCIARLHGIFPASNPEGPHDYLPLQPSQRASRCDCHEVNHR